MKIELKFGAWYLYESNWICSEQSQSLIRQLKEERDWEEREIYALGKTVIQPRLMRWGGAIAYRYSSQTLDPKPIPHYLENLMNLASQACDVPFNHLVINRYRNGQDHMALHADNEPELGLNPTIAALSVGTDRIFTLVPKSKKGRWKHTQKLTLEDGSLFVMGGRTQHTWRHAVPKSNTEAERFNITFRYIRYKPGEAPSFSSNMKNLKRQVNPLK